MSTNDALDALDAYHAAGGTDDELLAVLAVDNPAALVAAIDAAAEWRKRKE